MQVTIIRVGDAGMSSSIAPIGVDVTPDPLAINVVEPSPVSRCVSQGRGIKAKAATQSLTVPICRGF